LWFLNDIVNVGVEINEMPLKRPLLDFENLSIANSSQDGMLVFSFYQLVFFYYLSCLPNDIIHPFLFSGISKQEGVGATSEDNKQL